MLQDRSAEAFALWRGVLQNQLRQLARLCVWHLKFRELVVDNNSASFAPSVNPLLTYAQCADFDKAPWPFQFRHPCHPAAHSELGLPR